MNNSKHAEKLKTLYPQIAALWPQEKLMESLLSINVNSHVEKKNNLSYLSWAWAWAEVLKHDPDATWEAVEYQQPDGTTSPCMYMGEGSAMVKTVVIIKEKRRVCVLPVMDHRNKAIKNPDSFAINTAIMRCMTKAISMHGLGLYIYAGEDLPEGEEPEVHEKLIDKPSRSSASGPVVVSSDRITLIEMAASVGANKFRAGDKDAAFDVVQEFLQDSEEHLLLHQLLQANSAFRTYIKFRREADKKREPVAETEF